MATTKAYSGFGPSLRILRKLKGLNQGEIAEYLGVSLNQVSLIEKEQCRLQVNDLPALSQALNINLNILEKEYAQKDQGLRIRQKAQELFNVCMEQIENKNISMNSIVEMMRLKNPEIFLDNWSRGQDIPSKTMLRMLRRKFDIHLNTSDFLSEFPKVGSLRSNSETQSQVLTVPLFSELPQTDSAQSLIQEALSAGLKQTEIQISKNIIPKPEHSLFAFIYKGQKMQPYYAQEDILCATVEALELDHSCPCLVKIKDQALPTVCFAKNFGQSFSLSSAENPMKNLTKTIQEVSWVCPIVASLRQEI